MDKQEYEKVKKFTYLEYCDYLQLKYGIGSCDYMRPSWIKNPKISRSKDGLFAHHKYEDHAIMLANKNFAMRNPYEWQLAKNIVYCDYLEHLLLHILICEYPAKDKNKFEAVGIGGVVNYIVPMLNDYYSGWRTKLTWLKICLDKIEDNIDLYLQLLSRFKKNCNKYPTYTEDCLYKSENAQYGTWDIENNKKLFDKIAKL